MGWEETAQGWVTSSQCPVKRKKKAAGWPGLYTKPFTIIDLLGLEAEVQFPQPPPLPRVKALGGCTLLLELRFLCGQPCLLPTHLPFLPSYTESPLPPSPAS